MRMSRLNKDRIFHFLMNLLIKGAGGLRILDHILQILYISIFRLLIVFINVCPKLQLANKQCSNER